MPLRLQMLPDCILAVACQHSSHRVSLSIYGFGFVVAPLKYVANFQTAHEFQLQQNYAVIVIQFRFKRPKFCAYLVCHTCFRSRRTSNRKVTHFFLSIFEALSALIMKIVFLRDVTPCNLVRTDVSEEPAVASIFRVQ
jgi:hypothetical protein